MKIAFVVGQFPALSETFILDQITGMIDRGHEVDIFANQPGDESQIHADVEKYDLKSRTRYRAFLSANPIVRIAEGVRLGLSLGIRRPRMVLRLLNVFRYGWPALSLQLLHASAACMGTETYDVIHCHFGNNAVRAACLREIGVLSGRMLTTFHGHDVNRCSGRRGAEVYRHLFAVCELFTSNTSFTGDQAARLGCRRDRVLKLPVGVKLGEYAYRPRRPKPGKPVRILSVGRFVEKKGIEYSIRAVVKAAERKPNLSYGIVGDGELRPRLERLIDELKARDFITLLGWKSRTDLLRIYDESDVFVLASVTARDGDREGQGLVLQEAQAMGLPVVSTLHNGIPEGVLDGESGFLVPERDVDAMADRLVYLIDHPDSWESMGKAGRRLVEEQFNIDKLNDRLVRIYQRLAQGEFDGR